jgi:hypothetical protein
MALKPDRVCLDYSIDYFLDEVQERGKCLVLSTGGSGVSNDNVAHMATAAAAPSGKVPLGVLLNDMVNVDLSKYHLNHHKDEVQKGGKVTILKKGQVTTNMIYPGTTPTAGAAAYLGASGYFTPTAVAGNGNPVVGRFDTSKDENGFAKVSINLP